MNIGQSSYKKHTANVGGEFSVPISATRELFNKDLIAADIDKSARNQRWHNHMRGFTSSCRKDSYEDTDRSCKRKNDNEQSDTVKVVWVGLYQWNAETDSLNTLVDKDRKDDRQHWGHLSFKAKYDALKHSMSR